MQLTYRQLQAELKARREQGIDIGCKLNQKREVLQAAYERTQHEALTRPRVSQSQVENAIEMLDSLPDRTTNTASADVTPTLPDRTTDTELSVEQLRYEQFKTVAVAQEYQPSANVKTYVKREHLRQQEGIAKRTSVRVNYAPTSLPDRGTPSKPYKRVTNVSYC